MPPKASLIGRTYPQSEPYDVRPEKIREFADAIGDANPAYRDRKAAESLGYPDVIAPPTFPIVLTLGVTTHLLEDPEAGLTLHRLLHSEQHFSYQRPIIAGDQLVCTLVVDNVRQVAGMELISTRTEVATVDGEPICTAHATLVHRPQGGG